MSLRFKLALSGSLLLALSLSLVLHYTLSTLRVHFESQRQARIVQLRPLLNAALAAPMLQRDYASVQAILAESLEDPGLQQLIAYDAVGRTVAVARKPQMERGSRDADPQSEFVAVLALSGQVLGSVTFTMSRADLDLAEARITRSLLGVSLLSLVLFSAVLWVLSGTVTRRLKRLVDASRSIRQGSYSPKLPERSNDEVGELVHAFSTMGDEIQRKVQELHALNEGLERQVEQRTRDLTTRTLELDRSVQALQTKTYLLNRAPFAVLVLDAATPDFRVLDATDTLRDLFGHDPEALIGQSVACLEPPDAHGVLLPHLSSVVDLARSQEWEADVRCGPGQLLWTRCLAFALRENPTDALRVALCLVDIQEVWQARQDQRRVAGDLQESNKLQSIGLAIAGIAHDLNTPVGIALTAATMMRDKLAPLIALPLDGAPTPGVVSVPMKRLRQLHSASELVAANVAKAGGLVKGLTATTSNASRIEWRKLWLPPFFESLLATLSPITHRAHCTVRVTCPSDLALFTEPGSLGQVITNLVVNATVHAFEGLAVRELHIEASLQAQQVVIRVADNGNGMPSEAAARAFTPFFTTRRAAGGSGLGLFSARRVTEEVLNGTLEMASTPGQGTVFRINLPFLDRPPMSKVPHQDGPGHRVDAAGSSDLTPAVYRP